MPTVRASEHPFADRLCAVIATPTAAEAWTQIRKALEYTKTLELRLDWLKSDRERSRLMASLKRHRLVGVTLLATCRRILGGGKLAGGAEAELYWLTQAREAGCQWCDLEIETLRELPGQCARSYPIPEKILLSIHDFERTPKLPNRFGHTKCGEVDAFKVAVKAQTLNDSLRVLKLASTSANVVAVPMGEVGLPARLLALREGSALAYAPVQAATAPGQVSLHDSKRLYRADAATRKTVVCGVIGNPIAHSLSPLLHNTGYIAAKRDAMFLPFLVENLGDFVKAIPEFGLRGISVTIPHKQTIMKLLNDCEPVAEKIGAINTVVVSRHGKLYGSNTDYIGVLRALEGKMKLCDARVLIFGAGGSARAAAFALSNAGAEVMICARREAAARELARLCKAQVIARRHLAAASFQLIVNATPVGMHPSESISPLSPKELNTEFVMDLIYRPIETELLRSAARKGIGVISGVEMFLAQGFAQWELFMRQRAPQAAMRRAVLQELRAGDSHTHRAKNR